jgi:hypothetical protein
MRGKYDRLMWLAKSDSLRSPAKDVFAVSTLVADGLIDSTFNDCVQPSDRAERGLKLLLSASGATQGALYLNRESGPELAAAIADDERLRNLAATVRGFVESELHDGVTATATLFDVLAPGPATGIDGCELVLLSHQLPDGFVITGVAALVCGSNATFTQPGALAIRLSRSFANLGDALALTSR